MGKIFKVKNGFCHILLDKIVLTKDELPGDIAALPQGLKNNRIILIISAFIIGFLFISVIGVFKDDIWVCAIFLIIGLYLSMILFRIRNITSVPVIERDKIVDIKFIHGVPGRSRSRFEIYYNNENKKIMKRLIVLGVSNKENSEEIKRAIHIMNEEFG